MPFHLSVYCWKNIWFIFVTNLWYAEIFVDLRQSCKKIMESFCEVLLYYHAYRGTILILKYFQNFSSYLHSKELQKWILLNNFHLSISYMVVWSKHLKYFGPRVYPKGSLVITSVVRLSVRPCVRPSVFKYLRDCSLVFSSFLHEVRAS